MNKIFKENMKKGVTFIILAVMLFLVVTIMVIYYFNGESSMPFEIGNITIVSSADIDFNKEEQNKEEIKNGSKIMWDLDINQINDVYIDVLKNGEKIDNKAIKRIRIENIKVENPKVGKIEMYMPSSSAEDKFEYLDQYRFNQDLTFKGGEIEDIKHLVIGNQGGQIFFRIANMNIGKFQSAEDFEIRQDGSLIKLINQDVENLKADASFDIVIDLGRAQYRGKVKFQIPVGNMEEKGYSEKIINGKNIVFKRD